MFGRWRKADGFKWVSYVPTQLRERRRQRKERLLQAGAELGAGARRASKAAADGAVAGGKAGLAGSVAAAHLGARGLGSLVGRLGDGVGAGSSAFGRFVSPGLAAASATLRAPQVARLIGLVAALALLGGGFRVASAGLDRESRIAIGVGIAGGLLLAVPLLFERYGPGLARAALGVLRTRRPNTKRTGGGVTAASDAEQGGAWPAWANVVGGVALVAALGWGGHWAFSGLVAGGPPLEGRASVTAAGLVRIGQDKSAQGAQTAPAEVALAGIELPEAEQRCGEGSRRWRCGADSLRALTQLVSGRTLLCEPRGHDAAGRTLAQCRDRQTDIGAELVRTGQAWADETDTMGYRAQETAAREARAGIWRSASTPPWEYRRKVWDEASRQAPDGCPIKGEVAGQQRTYHLPWSSSYERVRITPAAVKLGVRRWFCTEREAIEAGFVARGSRA